MIKRTNSIWPTINLYVFLLYIFLIPFNTILNRYVLGLMLISSLLIFRKDHFYKLNNPEKFVLINIVILYLYTILSLAWTDHMQHGLNQSFTFATFLLIPLGLVLSAENIKSKRNQFYTFFIGGNFLASIICLIQSFIHSFKEVDGAIIFNHRVYSTYTLNNIETIISGYSEFSYGYLSFLMHPSYFSMYIAAATLFSFSMLFYFRNKKVKIGLVILIIWFTLFQVLLATRVGYLTQFIVVILLIFYLLKRKYRVFYLILIVGAVISVGLLFNSESRIKKTVSDISLLIDKEKKSYQERDVDKRIIIWNEALELALESQPFGAGIGDFDMELQERFQMKGYVQLSNAGYNSHNQYIDSLGRLGILGLVLLLFFIGYTLFIFYKRKNRIPFILELLVALNLLFESMLFRLQGIVFISFFIFVHLLFKTKEEVNNG